MDTIQLANLNLGENNSCKTSKKPLLTRHHTDLSESNCFILLVGIFLGSSFYVEKGIFLSRKSNFQCNKKALVVLTDGSELVQL